MSLKRLELAGRELRSARSRLQKAMTEAKDAAVEAATLNGTPQTVIAKLLDVDRMTVRRWLGK